MRLTPIAFVLAVGSLAVTAAAHGGQYRGPGNVVPPNTWSGTNGNSGDSGGGGGGGTGSSSTGGSASSSGSATGAANSAAGTGPGGMTAGKRGASLDDDLTRWEFWWEFGKDPYLRLRDVVASGRRIVGAEDTLLNPRLSYRREQIERPNDDDRLRAADALAAALRQASDRDTASACLVALAKIGRDGTDWRRFDLTVPFLARNDQEQRETAALALGIAAAGDDQSLELLTHLVLDDEAGRRASGTAGVNERTRAFAAFGLGLQLRELRSPAPAFRTVAVLRTVLADRSLGWNLRVAAIEALGLFPPAWTGAAADTLRRSIVESLGSYYAAAAGPGEQLVQAHVPTAVARLLDRDDADAAHWRDLFAADLARSLDPAAANVRGKANLHVDQSCAMALGSLCRPWHDDTSPDAAICELLWRAHRDHRDQQTRSFALLALARIGGATARDRMLAALPAAGAAIELPWYAIGLGVWSARRMQEGLASGSVAEPDPAITAALRRAFREARTPAAIGALGLSLGLVQDVDSAVLVRSALVANAHRDDLAGYLALGLGLMGDDDAVTEVRALVRESVRRPQVLQQGVRTLGLLGDHTVVDDLCRQLQNPEPSLLRLSAVAQALGRIGDRRSLEPLLAMLADERLTPLTRAFAAVAIGMVCDRAALPWNAAYATSTNYRAATETLTDGASGILDIL